MSVNVSASVVIEATPEEVFQFVIDPINEPKWRLKSVESGLKTEGPMRVGTVGYSKAEVGRGKIDSIDWKVTKLENNKHATWDLLTGPLEGTGGYLVEPVNGGTKFTLEAHVRMKGPLGFLMAPIVKMIGGKMNKADVANLKKVTESK
ncbi:MAG: SRPBCC family protein [Candidatus Saccharimonadales bacterium]|nr:SRPBCC family protein [Candidatus Saccharimonadales bacterium]